MHKAMDTELDVRETSLNTEEEAGILFTFQLRHHKLISSICGRLIDRRSLTYLNKLHNTQFSKWHSGNIYRMKSDTFDVTKLISHWL